MIKLVNIQKSFGDKTVIDGVDLKVDSGERVSLIGPGGAGKSTLLKIILGLVVPEGGSVSLFDQSVRPQDPFSTLKVLKDVGIAFQQGGLFDFMTVKDNLMFALKHQKKIDSQNDVEVVRSLLAAVKLAHTENMYPHQLSGGMKKRVGIARALCTNPRLAIFDEPTSGLDPVTSTIVLNIIIDLAKGNVLPTLLIATTNVEIAIRFSERILILNEGKIIADGSWRDLLVDGTPWVKNFLGVRFVGLDINYAKELGLPKQFIETNWKSTGKS